jgi:anaphase-promoting complex subunit 2
VENMAETSKNEGGSGNAQELLGDEEVEDRSGASVENQLRMEMTMYEVYDIKFFINFEL